MVNELETELVKVRLTITEKEQEKEKKQKTVNALTHAGSFVGFLTLLACFGENKLLAFIPGSILVIIIFFSFKKISEISKFNLDIREAKKKKNN